MNLRRDALTIFGAALKAADAGFAVRQMWRTAMMGIQVGDFDRVYVIAAGKAAAPMAKAIQERIGDAITSGLVVTKYGHVRTRSPHWDVIEAGHPIPDEGGLRAAEAVRSLLQTINARDLLIIAISGGASALLSAPVPTLSLQDKQITTDLMLRAGANIQELNTVRKHLSFLKGGRLAALAYPATVVTLVLSDVIGDPLDVIASGPTAADSTTFGDALQVLKTLNLLRDIPEPVRKHLQRGAKGHVDETPKPRSPVFANVRNVIVGSNRLALQAAARQAKSLGYKTLLLSSAMEGEARQVAQVHAAILREVIASGNPAEAPACLLSGGECTVTVRGSGRGGRAQEFALAAASCLAGLPRVLLLSAGTDGTDGPTDAAGAMVTGATVAKGREKGLVAADFLARNDSYAFLNAVQQLVKTGATGTNVMDVCIMLAGAQKS